ncbi:MAG TPA: hypothetical protein PLP42_04600 [Acidobacteriota bacterium]|nr:hypothetical protein [Acidobacteriota bacterium]
MSLASLLLMVFTLAASPQLSEPGITKLSLFATSDQCLACHNGLVSPSGEDISIGNEWRPGMMANSARDPYWQAAVRRETMDHPKAQAEIENECAACHMPMMRTQANAGGKKGSVFAHLPVTAAATPESRMAHDGVSCSLCHQIQPDDLGSKESFTGGFIVDLRTPPETRQIFGQYDVDPGRQRVMASFSSFIPKRADHLSGSEACATCHTLYTHALGPDGKAIGSFPEQVPYLEWQHSAWRGVNSCQSCHMTLVQGETAISSVLGQPRSGFFRHDFLGANFFMPRIFNRYRQELGVTALPQELDRAAMRTVEHLREKSARLEILEARREADRLEVQVAVQSQAGHKLPTAYPSRRVWIHLAIQDGENKMVFESGKLRSDGSIEGNDNDRNPLGYEPHYQKIDSPEQVQIYEAIMGDAEGAVTTGLLKAIRYLKDNRILPQGFDKNTAPADVAVHGSAARDEDFLGGQDVVQYSIPLAGAAGPFKVEIELYYQPIAYRWAQNLAARQSAETDRFVRLYRDMAPASGALLAHASHLVR